MQFSAQKLCTGIPCVKPLIRQFVRISLFICFFLITTTELLLAIPVKAQDIAATPVQVCLAAEPVTSAFRQIEKQTVFRFIYRKADLSALDKLTLPPGKRTVEQAITELFKNSGFIFRQIDQNILVEKRTGKEKSRKISGLVISGSNHKPVGFALIELLRKSDSVLVGHGYSDTSGRFSVATEEALELLLRVSGMNYKICTAFIPAGDADLTLPPVLLNLSAHELKEVVVTAAQPRIQRKGDRFVIKIGNSTLSVDNNVWDVLKKVPMVNATESGNLSIIGKQGAVVYINGRKSNLSGESLYNYLKNLPTGLLNTIEVVTTPGAEYDASGNSGIINILFKKRESDGYQGFVQASNAQATYNSQHYNAALNFRKGKLGISFSPFYNRNRRFIPETHNTDFISLSTEGVLGQASLDRRENTNYFGESMSLEYNISPKQALTTTVNYNQTQAKYYYTGQSLFIDNASGKVDSGFISQNNRRINGHSLDLGLNYHIDIDTLGQSLNISGDYFNYLNKGEQTLYATLTGNGAVRQNELSILPQIVNSYTLALDYKKPLGKKASLKLGARSFNTLTNNNLYYAVANNAGIFIKDILRTTDFHYQEHINAAYGSLDYALNKKFSIVAGVRLEQSNTHGKELIHQNVGINKNYLNLFPTMSVNYTPDEDNQFSYSLSRRIQRPSFWELNTFRVYLNPNFYVEGNPFLQPALILKNEVTYTLRSKYIFLANYVHTGNAYSQFLLANDSNSVARGIRLNYGTNDEANLVFTFNQAVGKVLQSAFTATGTYTAYHGMANSEPINNSGFSGSFKLNNTIFISKKNAWTGYVNLLYGTPGVISYSQHSTYRSYASLNLALKKVAGKFTIFLYGNDLLKTGADRFYVNTLYARNYSKNYYDDRNIQLEVRYTFGNSKVKKNQQRENAAREIINRAGK